MKKRWSEHRLRTSRKHVHAPRSNSSIHNASLLQTLATGTICRSVLSAAYRRTTMVYQWCCTHTRRRSYAARRLHHQCCASLPCAQQCSGLSSYSVLLFSMTFSVSCALAVPNSIVERYLQVQTHDIAHAYFSLCCTRRTVQTRRTVHAGLMSMHACMCVRLTLRSVTHTM